MAKPCNKVVECKFGEDEANCQPDNVLVTAGGLIGYAVIFLTTAVVKIRHRQQSYKRHQRSLGGPAEENVYEMEVTAVKHDFLSPDKFRGIHNTPSLRRFVLYSQSHNSRAEINRRLYHLELFLHNHQSAKTFCCLKVQTARRFSS